MKKQIENLVGRFFGELEVLRMAEKDKHTKNHSTYWVCKCHVCGKEKTIARGHLTHSNIEDCGCRKGKSKGQRKMEEILDTNKIIWNPEYTFPDLKYKNSLRFDIAVMDKNGKVKYLIEWDGEQHFRPVPRSKNHNAEQDYAEQRIKDVLKNVYCIEHKIPLIRLPYTELKNLNMQMLKLTGNKYRITKKNMYDFAEYFHKM